jgi:hypothetical protein
MSTHLRLIAAAVTALAMTSATAQTYGNPDYSRSNGYGYGHSQSVRCESIHSRRTYCRVYTSGTVRLMRQLSRNACIEGRTWATSSQGIWVSNGCRADFAISSQRRYRNNGGYGGSNGPDGNYYNGSGYGNQSDYQDGNDGYRNDNNGYGDRNGDGYATRYSQVVRCDSNSDGRTYCRNETNGAVQLSRVYGGDCTEGQTWGSDRRGIWVSGDCEASFTVENNSSYDSGDYQH